MEQKIKSLAPVAPGHEALNPMGLCFHLPLTYKKPSKGKQHSWEMIRERLRKVSALLDSSIPGERQAAAAAVQRVVSSGGAPRKWRWSFSPHKQAAICLQFPEAMTDQEFSIVAKIAAAARSDSSDRRFLLDICSRVRRVALGGGCFK